MEPRHLVTTTTRTAALPPSLDRPRQSITMPGWKKLFPVRACVRALAGHSIRFAHCSNSWPGPEWSGKRFRQALDRRTVTGHAHAGAARPACDREQMRWRHGKSGAAFARAIGKGWRRRACFAAPIGSSACSIQPLGTKGFATRVSLRRSSLDQSVGPDE